MLATATAGVSPLTLVSALIIPLITAAGLAGTVLAFAYNLRKQRRNDLSEAITTWQQTADARREKINQLESNARAKDREVYQLRRRNNYLWRMLLGAKVDIPRSNLDELFTDSAEDGETSATP